MSTLGKRDIVNVKYIIGEAVEDFLLKIFLSQF